MAIVQAAGGTMNGSTWLDRTNYFETMPAHQMELALWLEADRMATLLEALSQENLDNQREVVKNEKRWSYDNRPYGSWQEKLQAHLFPPEHPYHHSTIGSMDDLDAASLEDVSAFFRTYYAPNNAVAVRRRRRRHRRRSLAAAERYFGRIPANPDIPPLGDLSLPLTLGGERRETVYDRVPLPRVHVGFRAPVFGDTRLDALELAGQILAGGKGSRLNRRLVRDERIAQDVALFTLGFVGGASICAGWATVRPGVDVARVEAAFHEELATPDDRARQRRRAGTGQGADRGRRAGLAPAGRGARRPAVDVRDAVRRPGPDQHDAAALPGGHPGGDPRRGGRGLPAGQPAGADLPARGHPPPTSVTLRRAGSRRATRRGGGGMSTTLDPGPTTS